MPGIKAALKAVPDVSDCRTEFVGNIAFPIAGNGNVRPHP